MPYRFIIIFIFAALIFYILIFQNQQKTNQPNQVNIANSNSPLKKEHSDSFIPNLPSIDQIFSDNHTWIATLSAQRLRTVIATGDVIPARSVNSKVLQFKDFNWPYLETAHVTRNADIALINLETPLIKNCPPTQTGMIFCGDERNVEGLVYAGVDVASLANNHVGNYGIQAVQETTNLLNENGILVTEVDGPVIKDIRGIKFAFLGYNDISKPQPGVSNVDGGKIKQEIAQARQKADIVVVIYHWGVEYRNQPDERQKYLGHLAIDAGADLVIGNHPHWIQPVEIYKDKLITYAHGNFVFDQMWSEKTKEGVIGKYTFYGDKLIDVEFIPIKIIDFGQPNLITDPRTRMSILNDMKEQTLKLSYVKD
jgi:poly-gamma-glutamate synthesis protein (capsule biosynthesis protein)